MNLIIFFISLTKILQGAKTKCKSLISKQLSKGKNTVSFLMQQMAKCNCGMISTNHISTFRDTNNIHIQAASTTPHQ